MPHLTRPPRAGRDPRALRHLRLVVPAPPPAPKKERRPNHYDVVFTEDEQTKLRTALANVRRAYTRPKLAEMMSVTAKTLFCAEKGRHAFSAALAVRLARVTGISLDAILRPGLHVASTCAACGRGPT